MEKTITYAEGSIVRNADSFLRFLNMLIDLIVIACIYFSLKEISESVFNFDFATLSKFDFSVLSLLLNGIYFIAMEYAFQKTLGKFITRTTVVNKKGERPTIIDIFIRTVCRLIPFDSISYLFTTNGFHDYFSGTRVVNDNQAV